MQPQGGYVPPVNQAYPNYPNYLNYANTGVMQGQPQQYAQGYYAGNQQGYNPQQGGYYPLQGGYNPQQLNP